MSTTPQPMTTDERRAIEDRWIRKTTEGNYDDACKDVQRCLQEVDRLAAEAGEAAP